MKGIPISLLVAASAAAWATTAPAFAAQCTVKATVTVQNQSGLIITDPVKKTGTEEAKEEGGLGLVHRVGRPTSGTQEWVYWMGSEVPADKPSKPYELRSTARQGGVSFALWDYWTIVMTAKYNDRSTVWQLDPHNGAVNKEAINKALTSLGGKDFDALLTAAGIVTTGGIAALEVPVAKIVTALVAFKGPSLVGFAGGGTIGRQPTDFFCGSEDEVLKVTIAIDKNEKVWMQIAGKKRTQKRVEIGQMVPTIIDPGSVRKTVLDRLKEKGDTPKGGGDTPPKE